MLTSGQLESLRMCRRDEFGKKGADFWKTVNSVDEAIAPDDVGLHRRRKRVSGKSKKRLRLRKRRLQRSRHRENRFLRGFPLWMRHDFGIGGLVQPASCAWRRRQRLPTESGGPRTTAQPAQVRWRRGARRSGRDPGRRAPPRDPVPPHARSSASMRRERPPRP